MLTPFTVFTPGNIRFAEVLPGERCPRLAQRTAKVLLVHGASPQQAGFTRRAARPSS